MRVNRVRVPNVRDLSERGQVRDLVSSLRRIRTQQGRTEMPVEEVRTQPKAESNRFRVVERTVPPSAVGYDVDHKNEVHFYVGGKWMRVMLEEIT